MVRGREVGLRGTSMRVVLAVALVGAACSVDAPADPMQADPADAVVEVPAPAKAEPMFTAQEIPQPTKYTQAPSIVNRDEIVTAMEDEYPPALRDAGVGGTVKIWFFITEDGSLSDLRVDESSGHEALDAAAIRVAQRFRFSPASDEGTPVPVWISVPVTFAVQ